MSSKFGSIRKQKWAAQAAQALASVAPSSATTSTPEVTAAPIIFINGHASDNGDGVAHALLARISGSSQFFSLEELSGSGRNHAAGSALKDTAEQYARHLVFDKLKEGWPMNRNTVIVFVEERFKDSKKDKKVFKEFVDLAKQRCATFISVILTSVRDEAGRKPLVSVGGSKEIQAVVVSGLDYTGQKIHEELCKSHQPITGSLTNVLSVKVLAARETLYLRPADFLDPSSQSEDVLGYGAGIIVTILRNMQDAFNGVRLAVVENHPEIRRHQLVWTVCDKLGSARVTYQKVCDDDHWWRKYGRLKPGDRIALPEHNAIAFNALAKSGTPRSSSDVRSSMSIFNGLTRSFSIRDSKGTRDSISIRSNKGSERLSATQDVNANDKDTLGKDFIERVLRERNLEGNVAKIVERLWQEKAIEMRQKEHDILQHENKLHDDRKRPADEEMMDALEVGHERTSGKKRVKQHQRFESGGSHETVMIALSSPSITMTPSTPAFGLESSIQEMENRNAGSRDTGLTELLDRFEAENASAAGNDINMDVDMPSDDESCYLRSSTVETPLNSPVNPNLPRFSTYTRSPIVPNLPRFSGYTEYDDMERSNGYQFQSLYAGGGVQFHEELQDGVSSFMNIEEQPRVNENVQHFNDGFDFESKNSFGTLNDGHPEISDESLAFQAVNHNAAYDHYSYYHGPGTFQGL